MDYADIASTAVSEVQETFKRVYVKVVDAVPAATPVTAQMERTQKFKAGPEGLRFNVKLETGGAVANVPDAKLLPRASRPSRKQGHSTLTHSYTVIAVGGQSIPLTADTRNAFVSNLEDNLEDGLTRLRLDLERQYNGDGRGILCKLETVVGAPVYGVTDPYGLVGAGPGTMLLIEDMDVAIINPADGSERGRTTLTAVDTAAEEATGAAAVPGAAIGDYVVLCNDVGAAGTDAVNNYLTESAGILAVTGTGDAFEAIDGAVHRRWNGTVIDGGAAALDETKLQTLDETVMARSGRKITLRYTTRGIRIKLAAQLATLRRYEGANNPIKGGFDGVEINGRTILVGDFCPKGHAFALNLERDVCGMADLVPMGYIDIDGSKLKRIEGRHAFRSDCWVPHQALWFMRSATGRLHNLTDDQSIVR